eukprot:3755542-Pleurochrysis_carterae.AAC.1
MPSRLGGRAGKVGGNPGVAHRRERQFRHHWVVKCRQVGEELRRKLIRVNRCDALSPQRQVSLHVRVVGQERGAQVARCPRRYRQRRGR